MTLAGTLTTLYSFDLTLGFPGGLIQANDGNFYGTTTLGGNNGYGTLFSITPRGVATALHSFDDSDGDSGNGLVQGSDGNLYGTTYGGGAYNDGTAFALVYGYTLSVATSGSGTLTSTDSFINCGSVCSFTYKVGNVVNLNATPSPGWTFTGWTGCDSAHANTCTVTMSSSRTVSASFSPTQSTYMLTVFPVGSGTGTVLSSDGQINCESYCSGSYAAGTSVSLTAVWAFQGAFGGWTGCDSSADNVCILDMNSARTVTASFTSGLTGLRFVPVTPCRVADTRNPTGTFGGPSLAGDTSRDFPVSQSACGIPSTALAYSLNVTVVPQSTLGYLTVWPAGLTRPVVSTLNSYDGQVKGDASIMPAGANGAISVFATDTTDVILDINGYFDSMSNPSALAFYPLTPCRVFDTRNGSGPLGGPYLNADSGRSFPVLSSACGLPSNAQAYSMNFSVVPKGPLGYLTLWPSDQPQPYVSTLNAYSGQNTANAAIVPAASNGDISAFVTNDSDLIGDINGYFAPPGHGGQSLYLLPPCRVSDTRTAGGAFNGTLTVPVAGPPCAVPSNAGAFVLNATVVPQGPLGYLTLWPDASSQPVASILNAPDGVVTSNMAIMPNLNGLIDAYVYATSNTDLILDILSYFAP